MTHFRKRSRLESARNVYSILIALLPSILHFSFFFFLFCTELLATTLFWWNKSKRTVPGKYFERLRESSEVIVRSGRLWKFQYYYDKSLELVERCEGFDWGTFNTDLWWYESLQVAHLTARDCVLDPKSLMVYFAICLVHYIMYLNFRWFMMVNFDYPSGLTTCTRFQ